MVNFIWLVGVLLLGRPCAHYQSWPPHRYDHYLDSWGERTISNPGFSRFGLWLTLIDSGACRYVTGGRWDLFGGNQWEVASRVEAKWQCFDICQHVINVFLVCV